MKVYEHFPFAYREQTWTVPPGVTSAFFECWGAAGGMSSGFHYSGATRVVEGGSAPATTGFTNDPSAQGSLGRSYSNNAGYAAGLKTVVPGEMYYVYVGGNGGPGYSSIQANSGYYYTCSGGVGGWNGGGNGGDGALVHQNLYNAATTSVNFTGVSLPNAATKGQLWHDTSNQLVKKCNTTYTAGNGTSAKWTVVTDANTYAVGGSGGGGGGATDIRQGGNAVSNRILVAGGSGGAGSTWHTTGDITAWSLQRVPATPVPPFGADETTATGPDKTWATAINYFSGGLGCGGLGGGTSPAPANSDVTLGGGNITVGGDGTPGTNRHAAGAPFTAATDSAGGGGGNAAGGTRGVGNGSPGAWAQGGAGGYASGGDDYWSDGGGGGGGGYYGGGGGGQGFGPVGGAGGGGGGGSNYVSLAFTQTVLVGGARPPAAAPGQTNGANGLGGFARISYTKSPSVTWTTIPRATVEGGNFDAAFTYSPAVAGGSGISHYVVGTAADLNATFPTTQTTVMVNDPTQTDFTHTFPAPAAGVNEAFFVQVVDTDGDASAWVPAAVGGVAAPVNTGAVITAPAAGSHFAGGAITWTPGDQSPEVAYRVGWSGLDPATSKPKSYQSGWKSGGSRVNLLLDPGFARSGSWSGMVTDATYPGASGANGLIAWAASVTDGSAVSTSETLNLLRPNMTYRLTLDVASNLANDTRPYIIQVFDGSGLIASTTVDLSTLAAGAYATTTTTFSPHSQGVYFRLIPSSLEGTGDPTQAVLGNTDAGQVSYLRNGLLELQTTYLTVDPEAGPVYFDGGTPGAAWSGTAHDSPSTLTGADVTTDTLPNPGTLIDSEVYLDTLSIAGVVAGHDAVEVTQSIAANPVLPTAPTVNLTADSLSGFVTLTINAADGAASSTAKTVSFDIIRDGTRIATGLTPDAVSRIATFYDIPASNSPVTYTVRANSAGNGFADTTTGTLTLVG